MIKKQISKKYIIGAFIFTSILFASLGEGSVEVFADVATATTKVNTAVSSPTKANIAAARAEVNSLPEGTDKDTLQGKLNAIESLTDMTMDTLTASANVDVYIVCKNVLSLSLSTSQVSFDQFGGTEDLVKAKAVTLTVNSSLPYDVNGYLATPIYGSRSTNGVQNTMDITTLQIKASDDSTYKTFPSVGTAAANKLSLVSDVAAGNGITHDIDLKLAGGKSNPADVYRTTIKFEIAQK
jgi:hypothetical protein